MDFSQSSYYKWNYILLSLSGQWPYQGRVKNFIRYYVLNIIIIFAIMTQLDALLKQGVKIETILTILPYITGASALLLIATTAKHNVHKFDDLWKRMRKDWASERFEEENKIKIAFAEESQFLTKLLVCILGIGQLAFSSITPFLAQILDILIPLNKTREPMLIFEGEFFVDRKKYYKLIMLESQIIIFAGVIIGATMQTTFFIHIHHIYGMFAVLGYRIKHSISDTMTNSKDVTNMSVYEKHYDTIVICIKRHQEALEFADVLNDYYGWAFVITLCISVFIISPSLVKIADINLLSYPDVLCLIIIIIYLFIINYMGQRLIDLSLQISEDTYFSHWYNTSPLLGKLLLLIIRRCDKPCAVNAYKIYSLSLDCFRMTMQACFSYFMVLKQIR